jgi:hypothetical protein
MDDNIEPGKWGVISGHINMGETPLKAAIRESEEESGILLQAYNLRYMGSLVASAKAKGPVPGQWDLIPVQLQTYLVVKPDIEPSMIRLSNEHSDRRFVNENGIMPLIYGSSHGRIQPHNSITTFDIAMLSNSCIVRELMRGFNEIGIKMHNKLRMRTTA